MNNKDVIGQPCNNTLVYDLKKALKMPYVFINKEIKVISDEYGPYLI